LIAASQLFPPGDSLQVARAKQARDLFSGDSNINQIHKLISLGSKRIEEGLANSNQALTFFNQGNHTEAVKAFEKAIAADPLEYSYRENAATSYYILEDLENALKQIDVVISDLNPLNGKCEYIKALIFLKFGDPAGACPLLRTSRDSGYPQAQSTLDQYCTNL
jgi:tetratricopeptide (TPR) repeat protein